MKKLLGLEEREYSYIGSNSVSKKLSAFWLEK